jgi:predicted transcriptional regulator
MNDPFATIAEEIVMVRKLMVFSLVNSGVSQEKLASALGVSQATISRLVGGAGQRSRSAKVKRKSKK